VVFAEKSDPLLKEALGGMVCWEGARDLGRKVQESNSAARSAREWEREPYGGVRKAFSGR